MSGAENDPLGNEFLKHISYVKVTFDAPESLGRFLSGLNGGHSHGRYGNGLADVILDIKERSAIMTHAEFENCLRYGIYEGEVKREDFDPKEVERIRFSIAQANSIND